MPSAITIGIEALRRAGWTTQVLYRPTVAVNARHRVYSTHPFEIVTRPPEWFESVGRSIQGDRALGLPALHPAWALADMLRTKGWGRCGLWPDDIEWDEIGEKRRSRMASRVHRLGPALPPTGRAGGATSLNLADGPAPTGPTPWVSRTLYGLRRLCIWT